MRNLCGRSFLKRLYRVVDAGHGANLVNSSYLTRLPVLPEVQRGCVSG